MDMLTGYAASHQHPVNIFVHMIGIPTIMLGVLIPLSMAGISIGGVDITAAHVLVVAFFLFYLTLDALFATVFLVLAILLAEFAAFVVAQWPGQAWVIAAVAFFGGYAAQFIGHAIEKSMPVLVRHPIQANLAAPFFTVVEAFKLLGLRDELFSKVQAEVRERRAQGS